MKLKDKYVPTVILVRVTEGGKPKGLLHSLFSHGQLKVAKPKESHVCCGSFLDQFELYTF